MPCSISQLIITFVPKSELMCSILHAAGYDVVGPLVITYVYAK